MQALCCHDNTGPLYSSQHDHELAERQNTFFFLGGGNEQSSPQVQKVPLTIPIMAIVKHASYDGYSLSKHQILLWIHPWSIHTCLFCVAELHADISCSCDDVGSVSRRWHMCLLKMAYVSVGKPESFGCL